HHHHLRLRSRGAATVPAAARRRVVLRKSLIEGGTGARASAVSSRPLESSTEPEGQAVSVRTSAAPERTRAATGPSSWFACSLLGVGARVRHSQTSAPRPPREWPGPAERTAEVASGSRDRLRLRGSGES